MLALQSLKTAQEIAELRGKTVEEIAGRKLARAFRSAEEKGRPGAREADRKASRRCPFSRGRRPFTTTTHATSQSTTLKDIACRQADRG